MKNRVNQFYILIFIVSEITNKIKNIRKVNQKQLRAKPLKFTRRYSLSKKVKNIKLKGTTDKIKMNPDKEKAEKKINNSKSNLKSKLTFQLDKEEVIEVELPPIKIHKKKKRMNGKTLSHMRNKRLMSPVSNNRTIYNSESESGLQYDEEKFLLYSTFRKQVLDPVLQSLAKEVATQAITTVKNRTNIRRRMNKNIVNGMQSDI